MSDRFEEIDLRNVESTFRSNILQMFAVTKFALPHLKRGSSIINTTSVTAYSGAPTLGTHGCEPLSDVYLTPLKSTIALRRVRSFRSPGP